MLPVLSQKANEIAIIQMISLRILNRYHKNKLVLLEHPFKKDEKVIRVLIGLEGDWVQKKDHCEYHKIPKGYCWVESLKGEEDSNSWGLVILNLTGFNSQSYW